MRIISAVATAITVDPGKNVFIRRDPKHGAIYQRQGKEQVMLKIGEGNYKLDPAKNELVRNQLFALQEAKMIQCSPPIELPKEKDDVRGDAPPAPRAGGGDSGNLRPGGVSGEVNKSGDGDAKKKTSKVKKDGEQETN